MAGMDDQPTTSDNTLTTPGCSDRDAAGWLAAMVIFYQD